MSKTNNIMFRSKLIQEERSKLYLQKETNGIQEEQKSNNIHTERRETLGTLRENNNVNDEHGVYNIDTMRRTQELVENQNQENTHLEIVP